MAGPSPVRLSEWQLQSPPIMEKDIVLHGLASVAVILCLLTNHGRNCTSLALS